MLHEVVFHARKRVPHAGGALLEFGVLIVRVEQLLVVVVSMLTAAVAAIVRYQWFIRLQRVLIGITKWEEVNWEFALAAPEWLADLLSVLGCWRSSMCALACLGHRRSGLLVRLKLLC